ncbi:MAG: hypothetical protein HOP33_11270 [Verrucomicrobia bacterium]|nr:hypothetical protein [Verrucomicrobiota bacterium]
MRKPKCWVSGLVLGLVVAGVANQVHATMYTIGNGGLESGWNLNIDGTSENGALVGGIKLTPGNPLLAITSVCLDVKGTVYLGTAYNFVTVAFNGQDGLNPNWGYGNSGGGALVNPATASLAIQNAARVFDLHKAVLASGTTQDRAALQLAVWEALYDTGNPLGYSFIDTTGTGGRFEASRSAGNAARVTALSWLNGLYDSSGNLKPFQPYTGSLLQPLLANGQPNSGAQEMMGTLTAPVPEPTTIIAGALLLLPFGASTIRFLRRNVANADRSSRS